MYKLDLEKVGEPDIKLPTSTGSQKKQELSRKTSTSASLTKVFGCVDHNKVWKILQEMGIPDHLPASWDIYMQVKKQQLEPWQGTMDWFPVGKGVCQGCMLSPSLFNLNAEYTTWKVKLDESQAGIKIAGRNINNLRYADGTTLIAKSEEELKSLLKKVKEESEKDGLKLKKLRSWHPAPPFHGKYMGEKRKQWQTLSSWFPKSLCTVTAATKLKDTCSLEKKEWQA